MPRTHTHTHTHTHTLRVESLESRCMLAAFDLAGYVLQTNRTVVDLPTISNDTSGVAYVPGAVSRLYTSTDPSKNASFFTIVNNDGNNNGRIVEFEYSTANQMTHKNTITLTNFTTEEPGNAGDPEGITWMGGNTFAFVRERVGRIAIVTIAPGTTSIDRNSLTSDTNIVVQVGSTRITGTSLGNGGFDNDGLEGIAYDPVDNAFYVAKEKNWLDVDQINGPEAVYKVFKVGSSWQAEVVHIAGLLGTGGVLTAQNDISDIYYADNTLFLTNHESPSGDQPRIIKATRNPTTNQWSTNSSQVRNLTPTIGAEQVEGIAFDPAGLQMFVVSEPDQFYEFRNFTAPAQRPRMTAADVEPSFNIDITVDAPPGATVSLFKNGSNVGSATLAATDTTHTFSFSSMNQTGQFTAQVTVGASTSLVSDSLRANFDGDGDLDLNDLNALYDRIFRVSSWGSDDPIYDLNGDRRLDAKDVELWIEGFFGTYLGDATLDGTVNAADLNAVGMHWQQTGNLYWWQGNFNADGIVNAADLNILSLNWQKSRTPNPT